MKQKEITFEFANKHHTESIPVRALARQAGVNINTMRRAMIKLGVRIKNRSESMKDAFKAGTIETREYGPLSDETKEKIALSVQAARKNMKSSTQTTNNKLLDKNIHSMRGRAARKIRDASVVGSKFENMLLRQLQKHGFKVIQQYELKDYKIDLYIPVYKTAIEIDGLSHREPIYGDDKLAKSQTKDSNKDTCMKQAGMNIIRVHDNQNKARLANAVTIGQKIKEIVETKKKFYEVLEAN